MFWPGTGVKHGNIEIITVFGNLISVFSMCVCVCVCVCVSEHVFVWNIGQCLQCWLPQYLISKTTKKLLPFWDFPALFCLLTSSTSLPI